MDICLRGQHRGNDNTEVSLNNDICKRGGEINGKASGFSQAMTTMTFLFFSFAVVGPEIEKKKKEPLKSTIHSKEWI